jgi:hypothetical protein
LASSLIAELRQRSWRGGRESEGKIKLARRFFQKRQSAHRDEARRFLACVAAPPLRFVKEVQALDVLSPSVRFGA